MRAPSALLVVLLLSTGLVASGCLTQTPDVSPPQVGAQMTLVARTADGAPVPFLPVTLVEAAGVGKAVSLLSSGVDGQVTFRIPEGATMAMYPDGERLLGVSLQPGERVLHIDAAPTVPLDPLRYEASEGRGLGVARLVELGSWAYMVSANAATCRDTSDPFAALAPTHDCGLSEPTIEVDNAGTIYASAVCCVGGAPPIWVSRDDGATWDTLDTPLGQREAFGIEGDFAIDDEGTMYFFDIELGAVQVSAWTADGTHLHTTHQPAPPLVDRPWVRAEGDGTVYLVYNQGIGFSSFLRSTDHGRTFLEMSRFPHYFGNIARGDEPGELLFAAPGAGPAIATYESKDGGLTWGPRTDFTAPDSIPTYAVPLIDDAGNRYVVFDGTATEGEPGYIENEDDRGRTRVYYAWAPPEGDWSDPIPVSPPTGTHTLAWGTTAAPGTLAFAWYGTTDTNATQNSVDEDAEWYLFLATTLDATSDSPAVQTIIADPVPVLTGPMDRRLLDFLQIDVGPDGALHVAYAHIPEGSRVETTSYVQTFSNLPLVTPDGLRHGPR